MLLSIRFGARLQHFDEGLMQSSMRFGVCHQRCLCWGGGGGDRKDTTRTPAQPLCGAPSPRVVFVECIKC